MGARVTVTWQGLDEVISRLSEIETKGQENLVSLTRELAKDTEEVWQDATPEGKTGKLRGGEKAEPDGLSFTLNNSVRYYPFVDAGHWTPRGWRIKTKHGWTWRWAKRRSRVAGREMTGAAVDFVEANITGYLSRFLNGA